VTFVNSVNFVNFIRAGVKAGLFKSRILLHLGSMHFPRLPGPP
jgi:hypothetical protein